MCGTAPPIGTFPSVWADFVAEQLPHGRSTIVAGAGHVSILRGSLGEILTQATA